MARQQSQNTPRDNKMERSERSLKSSACPACPADTIKYWWQVAAINCAIIMQKVGVLK